MSLQTIDLIVPDVLSAAAFFTDIVGLGANVLDERFAELNAGTITIMLSPDAMVPINNAAGVILHFQVDDVSAAVSRASAAGVKVLKGPLITDWGWESCLVAGPAGVVVDFYRPIE